MSTNPSADAEAMSFADLRASFSDNAEALAILDVAEREGKTPGAAAFAIITSGCLSQTEEQDRATFAASTAIQNEFLSADSYVAWRRAARRGSAKIVSRSRPGTTDADMAKFKTEAEASSAFRASPALKTEFLSEENFLATWRHASRRRRTH